MTGERGAIDPLGETTATPPGSPAALAKRAPAPGALDATALPDAAPAAAGDATAFLRPFGPYAKVEPLSEQGTMGVVARGYNAAFERWELLKFLRAEHAADPELLRQFQREGKILARLAHPNIVSVFAIYELDRRPCLAMEFLEGESLAATVARAERGLPIERANTLFLDAARGLAAAHDVGLLHRDLKPENLFVVAGRRGAPGGLKLIDFGLATADRTRPSESDPSLASATSGGTPLYMAPELWRGEEGSPRTDVFALGLAFYLALAGRLPFDAETSRDVVRVMSAPTPFPDVREQRPEVPHALSAVVARAIAKRPEDRFATADELVAALAAASAASRQRRVPGSGPYRGLASFSASERDVFFGRDVETAEVLERLRAQSGIILAGPSGSGKSSLAHAGVVPAIEEGALGSGVVFSTASLTPRAHPVAALAAALARAMGTPEKDLTAFLRASPRRLGEALREALPASSGLLLVVDQLEELATLSRDAGETRDFAAALGSLVEVASPSVRVIATVRADLMDRLFALESLRPLLARGFYPVRPLVGEGLRRAIEEPARAAGFSLGDPRVVDAIVAEAGDTAAALPLVSFAMAAWWARRDEASRVLPLAAWTELGGLGGALAAHGDGVLAAMTAPERAAAEQVLVRLVTAEGTRSRASRVALLDPAAALPGAERALERLLEAKLVVESSGEIELVHEALIRAWPRLGALLVSSGEDRAFRERITAAAREWDAQKRPDGALWSGEQAARLVRWLSASASPLGQLELAFVEEVRRIALRRKLVVRSIVLSTILVALAVGLTAKGNERQMATELAAEKKRSHEAEEAFRRAEAGRLHAVAEARADVDPQGALKAAMESYDLVHEPALDLLAWRARAVGVPSPLPLHTGGASLVRFSPNGGRVATAGHDGIVRVLAAASPDHASARPSHDRGGQPRSLAFAADGERIAIGTSVGEIVVAAAPTFPPSTAGRCEGSVEGIAWQGATVFARCVRGEHDSTLVAVDVAQRTSREIARGDLAGWAIAPATGRLVVARQDGKITVFDGAASTESELPKGTRATAVALTSDGARLAIGTADGAVLRGTLDDQRKLTAVHALASRHVGAVPVVHFDPSGAILLSLGNDRSARLHDESGTRVVSSDLGGGAHAWLPKRSALALTGRNGDVLVVGVRDGAPLGRFLGATSEIASIDADPAGRFVVVASTDGGVRAYSFAEAAAVVTRAGATPAPICATSPDGAALGCLEGREARVIAIEGSIGATPRPAVALAGLATGASVSSKGEHLAVWRDGALFLDGEAIATRDKPLLAAFASDGALAIAERDGAASAVFVRKGGREDARVTLPAAPTVLAFAPGGGALLVGLESGAVRALGVAAGTLGEPLPLPRHDVVPRALAVSDDGAFVAIGARDGSVLTTRVDGTGTGKSLARLHGAIGCVAWSQSGRALVVAAERRVFVLDEGGGGPLTVALSPAAVTSCARSPIDDRFSFVAESGATWLRYFDLSPLATSRIPDAALDARTATADAWRGFASGALPLNRAGTAALARPRSARSRRRTSGSRAHRPRATTDRRRPRAKARPARRGGASRASRRATERASRASPAGRPTRASRG